MLNVPITQETTEKFKADFDDLKDIIIVSLIALYYCYILIFVNAGIAGDQEASP